MLREIHTSKMECLLCIQAVDAICMSELQGPGIIATNIVLYDEEISEAGPTGQKHIQSKPGWR